MAFLLRRLTASFVIALYNVVDTLLTIENKLYLRHDWNGEQLWQGLDPGEASEGRSTFLLGQRGHGYGGKYSNNNNNSINNCNTRSICDESGLC